VYKAPLTTGMTDRLRIQNIGLSTVVLSQGNALISKLQNVLDKIARGNITAAVNQLGAFINQV
jgi:hypothetical protein